MFMRPLVQLSPPLQAASQAGSKISDATSGQVGIASSSRRCALLCTQLL